MIFLDANAFYSYFGRKKLGMNSNPVNEGKLKNFLDMKKIIGLPTSVFIEIIVHFRDNPKLLNEMLDFINLNRLKIFNNLPEYVINKNELNFLSLRTENSLKNYAHRLLKNKIDIESRFTVIFLEITVDLYAQYKLDLTNELTEDEKNSILNFIVKDKNKDYGLALKKEIEKELKKGYDENKEQYILKNYYIKELNEICLSIDSFIATAIVWKKDTEKEANLVDVWIKAYDEAVNLGMDGQNGTMPCIVDTFAKNKKFLLYAKSRISDILMNHGHTKSQSEFLKEVMFTSWFERGQKLNKNDIFDMFCVGCLDYVDKEHLDCPLIDTTSYIITFDKRMKTFLGKFRPYNLKLIDSIDKIIE